MSHWGAVADASEPTAMKLRDVLFVALLWQLMAVAAVVSALAGIVSETRADILDSIAFFLAIEGLLWSVIANQFGWKRGVYEISLVVGVICLGLPIVTTIQALLDE